MFSICKSESTKPGCHLLDLEPLKQSIAERTMEKDTLIIIIIILVKINKKKITIIIYNYLSAIPRVDSHPLFHAQAWLSENTIIINKKHTNKIIPSELT